MSYSFTLILPTDTPETVTIQKRTKPFTFAEIRKLLGAHMEIVPPPFLGGGNLDPRIIAENVCEEIGCTDFFTICTQGGRLRGELSKPLNGYATRLLSMAVAGPVLICSAELLQ